eukprot:1274537-Pyramimonas_sp.AAC.1
MVAGAHVFQEFVGYPLLPAVRVESDLVFRFAFALLLTHMPAPRVPGCVEVASPLGLQPLQACDCCLARAALPADAEDCPRAAGFRVAAIIPAVRAAWFWLSPGGAPCVPATVA